MNCNNCEQLDKSKKAFGNCGSYRYGCNSEHNKGFMCGWIPKDKDISKSYVGCTNWTPKEEQMRLAI